MAVCNGYNRENMQHLGCPAFGILAISSGRMAHAWTLFSSLPAKLQVGLFRRTLCAPVDVLVLGAALEDGGGETVVGYRAAKGTV